MKKKFEYAKLNLALYGSIGVGVVALYGLWWFLAHSFITIKPLPKDAIITIDNDPLWLSPFGIAKKTLYPGVHIVRVEAEGYMSFVQEVSLKRSQNKKISVNLKEVPKPVTLEENVKFLSKDTDFNSVYYLNEGEKRLYKSKIGFNDDGQVEVKSRIALTDSRIVDVNEIIWSPDHQLALFRKEDGIYLFDFKKYDFINQTETKWGDDIGSIAWSPDNSKIAYYYAPKGGEKSLIFSNAANTELNRVANLADLNIQNPILRWSPDSEWLLVIPRNTPDYTNNKIYAFNAYSRSFKELTNTGSQVDALFSPDSNKVVYSTYSQSSQNSAKSILSIMDKDGSNQQSLNVHADITKTVWMKDSKNIVIAGFDSETGQASISTFNTDTKAKGGFAINTLDSKDIKSILVSDDGKLVIYQASGTIYALEIN